MIEYSQFVITCADTPGNYPFRGHQNFSENEIKEYIVCPHILEMLPFEVVDVWECFV